MVNIIQQFFLLIPNFKVDYFGLLPIIAMVFVGFFVEHHYTSKLTFFLNSVALISHFGIKNNVNQLASILSLLFFILSTWSFLSFISKGAIPPIKQYEEFIDNHQIILKFGGSFVVGMIILLDWKF